VGAIDERNESYEISAEKCIGCGLCLTTCPEEAIMLLRRPEGEIVHPPADEAQRYKDRGQARGVDFSKYE
jgi:Fe-S-cluster-containing hydrogenase component 2